MSFGVLARLVHAASREFDHVNFIWHGGEPTLLPISFFEKALVLESRFRRPGQTFKNTFQTNGSRLTDDWGRFLKKAGFETGISLDGPPEIHDRNRPSAGGGSSYSVALSGLDLLVRHKLSVGVLTVVDQTTLAWGPENLFDFFVFLSSRGASSFSCLPARPVNQPDALPGTHTEHYVGPAPMSKFLIRLYDRWLEHGDPSISIREIEAVRPKHNGQHGVCQMDGKCLGKYFTIEPDGRVALCALFNGDERYALGNILEQDFGEIVRADALQRLRDKHRRDVDQMCADCPEFSVCRGWCPHQRYLSERHDPGYSKECCGPRALIEHLRRHQPDDKAMRRRLPSFADSIEPSFGKLLGVDC